MNNKSYGKRLATLEMRAAASLDGLHMSKQDMLTFLQGCVSDESMAAVQRAYQAPHKDAVAAAFQCLTDDELRRIAALTD